MKWLTDPDEALKHPRRRQGALLFVGFILGGYIGYRVFDGSLGWTLVVGTCFGGLLAALETRAMRDLGWAVRQRARQDARPGVRTALLRLSIPFLVLIVAFALGVATGSENVFIVAAAVGMVVGLAVRLSVLR
jgi:hypothetical protein